MDPQLPHLSMCMYVHLIHTHTGAEKHLFLCVCEQNNFGKLAFLSVTSVRLELGVVIHLFNIYLCVYLFQI